MEEEFQKSITLMRSFANVQKNMLYFIQKTATENGLSVPQYTVLLTILPDKQMTQKIVGEKTFLPKSTLSQAVDGLVQMGLLDRQQVEGNRREMQLSLNEKGVTFIKKIHFHEGSVHQVFRGAVESLTEKQYNDLLKTHLQIATYIESQRLEAGEDGK